MSPTQTDGARTEDEKNAAIETDLFLKSLRGDSEVEFSIDPDGDLYIQIRERKGVPTSAYISGTNAGKLRRWLNEVSK